MGATLTIPFPILNIRKVVIKITGFQLKKFLCIFFSSLGILSAKPLVPATKRVVRAQTFNDTNTAAGYSNRKKKLTCSFYCHLRNKTETDVLK